MGTGRESDSELSEAMKRIRVNSRKRFEVLINTRGAQAAQMSLRPGDTSDSYPGNEHRHSEQWLFVISGSGTVRIGKRRQSLRTVKIRTHTLLVIEKGELHQIKNSGRKVLTSINIYVPPAYDPDSAPKR